MRTAGLASYSDPCSHSVSCRVAAAGQRRSQMPAPSKAPSSALPYQGQRIGVAVCLSSSYYILRIASLCQALKCHTWRPNIMPKSSVSHQLHNGTGRTLGMQRSAARGLLFTVYSPQSHDLGLPSPSDARIGMYNQVSALKLLARRPALQSFCHLHRCLTMLTSQQDSI
ncbi:hypothetical protein BAUCODRAFT_444247 [Baudoinia panamericana UAMH 10762]|uniref:Uncharacterized protein n=1 Tax=Baudoinia panamericana (strain UAMH 10762) TaxID=717646 RepID=M2MKJ6_BAUPA|nr:uncharacterized protein BAUCODRAFT_444247 [Baudoinia panamericana UAMH 10762]EMC97216.1 hypothetical protein BAUCODRAFT_444247 [Baudoinia panamericana UAMH 10762]